MEKNSKSFTALLPTILSRIFILVQDPNLATLNKSMYNVSQQLSTIANYIVRYTELCDKPHLWATLDGFYNRYKRLKRLETAGKLVLKGITSMDYNTALRMALEYSWCNILKDLFRIYVLIEKKYSTVVYTNNMFETKEDYQFNDDDNNNNNNDDDDSDDNEKLAPFDYQNPHFSDIQITENLYLRPLIATRKAYDLIHPKLDSHCHFKIIKTFLLACKTSLQIPHHHHQILSLSCIENDFYLTDNKVVITLLVSVIRSCCYKSNIGILKSILELSTTPDSFSIRDYTSLGQRSASFIVKWVLRFMSEYGYKNQNQNQNENQNENNWLLYISCLYCSFQLNKPAVTKFLDSRKTDKLSTINHHNQIKFDLSIYLGEVDLVLDMFQKVEPSFENIEKLISVAYLRCNIRIIKHLLNAQYYLLNGRLCEHALQAAIRVHDFEVTREISSKYSGAITETVVLEAVKTGDLVLINLLIEAGMDMKTGSVGSQGIRYACIYNDIDILRLFLEKGAKISQSSGFILAAVCDEHNYNRKLVHELVNVPTNSRNSNNLNEDESMNEKNLEIGSCNVKPPGNTLSFNKIFKFLLERLTISRRQAMIFMRYPELRSFSLDDNEFTGWHIIYCLRRPTGDLTQLVQNKLFELLYYIDYNRLHPHSYLHNQQQQCTNLETVKKDKTSNDSVTRNLAINCMILSDWDYEITNSQMANKYLGMVQLLIDNGLDTNAGHHVVLRTAYKLGDIKWIRHFIKNGAKLGKERYAGLNEACQSDNIVVLEQWFENGGVVPKNPKYNGVQIACGLGNFEMLKLLIEKGAALDNPEYNGVKEACELNHVEILNYLIENNATIGRFRNYQLDNAVMVGDIELVGMILEYYTSIDVLEQTQPADLVGKSGSILSLTQTLENNSQYYEHVKTILKNGYIIEPRHLAECLWMAVALRRDEIAKVLCEYSFKPHNETDSTNPNIALGGISRINLAQYYDDFETKKRDLLAEAIKSDNIPLTKLLLLNNFKVENDPHELVQHLNGRNLEMIKLLLEYRPNLSKDPTLLYRAVGTDSIEAVGFLLQRYGVVQDIRYNPIAEACKNNSIKVLNLLLLNMAEMKGYAVGGIIQASKNNNLEIAQLLLQNYPNLVLGECYGIPEALNNGNIEMVKLLVKHGARVRINTHSGMLLALAFSKNDLEFIEYSLSLSPKPSKNFVRKLRRMAGRNGKEGEKPVHKKSFISRMILEHLGLM